MLIPRCQRLFSEEAIVLTKATIRAADRLGVSQKMLASIIGLSEGAVSRLRHGTFALERGHGKAFELAELFVRLFAALDAIVCGDEATGRAWLRSENSALRGRPIDIIQNVRGLANVVNYLRVRRMLD